MSSVKSNLSTSVAKRKYTIFNENGQELYYIVAEQLTQEFSSSLTKENKHKVICEQRLCI